MGGGGSSSEPGPRGSQGMSFARWIGLVVVLLGLGFAFYYAFVSGPPTTGNVWAIAVLLFGGVALIVLNPKGDIRK